MGMSKLNIFVSAMDNPCGIDQRTWYVTIYDCDGNVFEYCGKKYVVLPAKCGHLEVEVPPGIYYVKAVWSFSFANGIYYVNHFTDAAIVQVCCDDHVCVKLFNPSIHRCGTIIVRAVQDLALQKVILPEDARQFENLMKKTIEKVPIPAKKFELAHLDEIEKLVREAEKKGK